MERSSVAYARILKGKGMEPDLADAVVEIMESILGTPLNEAVFQQALAAQSAQVLAKFDVLDRSLGEQIASVQSRLDQLGQTLGARQEASEARVLNSVARERVLMLGGIGSVLIAVATVGIRLWWLGHL